MAWLEVHQELPDHPKIKRLMRALGLSRHAAIGVVIDLWLWALRYARTGELGAHTDEDVADGIGWDGDAADLMTALTTAGLLDPDRSIHDWGLYAGRLIERQQQDAVRKKREREKQRAREESAPPIGCPPDIRRTSARRRPESGVPDHTGPDHTGPETAAAAAVDAPIGATMATAPLSADARHVLNTWRQAHGQRRPPKLNPVQQGKLEAALNDLGLARLLEAVEWSASQGVTEFPKALRAAYTKRDRDEQREHTPPGASGGRRNAMRRVSAQAVSGADLVAQAQEMFSNIRQDGSDA